MSNCETLSWPHSPYLLGWGPKAQEYVFPPNTSTYLLEFSHYWTDLQSFRGLPRQIWHDLKGITSHRASSWYLMMQFQLVLNIFLEARTGNFKGSQEFLIKSNGWAVISGEGGKYILLFSVHGNCFHHNQFNSVSGLLCSYLEFGPVRQDQIYQQT